MRKLDDADARAMAARDWFGVGVRLLGLWQMLNGLTYVVSYGEVFFGVYTPSTGGRTYPAPALLDLLSGAFLLFGVRIVVNAAYPEMEAEESENVGFARAADAEEGSKP